MTDETPCDPTSPLMVEWERYKQTDDYANTRRWALVDAHVDGSLWAAFSRGFATGEARRITDGDDRG
jgi:hypothetical protein